MASFTPLSKGERSLTARVKQTSVTLMEKNTARERGGNQRERKVKAGKKKSHALSDLAPAMPLPCGLLDFEYRVGRQLVIG